MDTMEVSPESDTGILKDYIQKYSCCGDKP